jgi:hypothetical protein
LPREGLPDAGEEGVMVIMIMIVVMTNGDGGEG